MPSIFLMCAGIPFSTVVVKAVPPLFIKIVLSPGGNPFVQEMALPIFMVLIVAAMDDACTASPVVSDWQEDKPEMNGKKSKIFSIDFFCMNCDFCLPGI